MKDLLVTQLDKHQPSIIPAAIALWVVAHCPLCLIQTFATESVVPCETAELVEKVVGGHVISPCAGHRLLESKLVFFGCLSCDTFNAAKFSECVDTMRIEGIDKLTSALLSDSQPISRIEHVQEGDRGRLRKTTLDSLGLCDGILCSKSYGRHVNFSCSGMTWWSAHSAVRE